ncbi:tetratricopeptide repeat protein [bacterium BMS3Abin07]|nr:tetratricopeptide repeat protein [bacterium BMS3Abin07]GBE31765.1 tetratricopeptide repeat protein [bacterium BMS3Bbin05]HDL20342.1 tetratricopeptide repeat protein [Nitrospirota bacterium]HDO23495.1 tetratricopeptide repeat protein [Nitrospirota bacterium]HDZ88641.1 tetratricopeptide repeat protein [Nitrospirota bacterium]
MSLLADLLSKARRADKSRKDVPPALEGIVKGERRGGTSLRRFAIIGSLSILAVASGFVALNLIQGINIRKDAVKPPQINRSTAPEKRVPAQRTISQKSVPDKDGQPVSNSSKRIMKTQAVVPSKKQNMPGRLHVAGQVRPERHIISKRAKAAAQAGRYSEVQIKNKMIDSGEADSYIYAGRQFEMERKYPDAVRQYRKALVLRPSDPFILNSISYLFLKMRLPEKGLMYALKAADARHGYVPAVLNAGISYAEMGNDGEAEKFFKRAVNLDPFNRETLYNLGLFYERRKEYEMALNAYRRLVDTGEYSAFMDIARALELSGKRTEAIRVYKGIIGSDVISKEVKNKASLRLSTLSRAGR